MRAAFEGEYGKRDWRCWEYRAGDLKSLKRARPSIPCEHGVYIIRAPEPLPRVRGASNVVYVGQSGGGSRGGKQGIGPGNGGPGRLFNTRGADELVRKRIEGLFPNGTFVVECTFVSSPEDPEELEARLLRAYVETHCELPPANHAQRALERSVAEPNKPVRPTLL